MATKKTSTRVTKKESAPASAGARSNNASDQRLLNTFRMLDRNQRRDKSVDRLKERIGSQLAMNVGGALSGTPTNGDRSVGRMLSSATSDGYSGIDIEEVALHMYVATIDDAAFNSIASKSEPSDAEIAAVMAIVYPRLAAMYDSP